jgi:CXXX repeat modification system protein
MENKVIGIVTEEEKNEIERLFERKNGLSELMLSLPSNSFIEKELSSSVYEKLVLDMGKTKTAFDKWWSDMQAKYNWESTSECSYEINFETNEIILMKNQY